jgi:hypothetical protein
MMEAEHRTSSAECRKAGDRLFSWRSMFDVRNSIIVILLAGAGLITATWFGGSVAAETGSFGIASNLTMTGFTTAEYYDPPNETTMKTLLSGAEVQPQPDGSYPIKELRLELFDEAGKQQVLVEAPECTYDPAKRIGHSAGPLKLHSGDGRLVVEGEGFLWQQDASTLIISNKVHTTIRDVMFQSVK